MNPLAADERVTMEEANSATTSDPWVEVDAITRRTAYNLIETEMDREKIYTAANAFIFSCLCDILMIDRTAVNLRSKAAKRTLFTLMIDLVSPMNYDCIYSNIDNFACSLMGHKEQMR